jgi:predicted acyl esterase
VVQADHPREQPVPEPGHRLALSEYREAFNGGPPRGDLRLVDRDHGTVWRGEPLEEPLRLRGRARCRLTVTPSAPQGTIVAYLLDVDAGDPDRARLIHQVPYTWRDVTPGRPLTLDVAFPDMAYDLAAGHRLGLVITTHDVLYRSENGRRAPVVLGSAPRWPATLEVPAR